MGSRVNQVLLVAGSAVLLLMLMGSASRARVAHSVLPPSRIEESKCTKKLGPLPGNDNRRSRKILVPSGAQMVLLCRYAGSGNLGRERWLSKPTSVESLIRAFDQLQAAPSGPHGCFFDNGASMLAYFAYGQEPQVPLRIGLSGCTEAYNGHPGLGAFVLTPSLVRRLKALTAIQSGGA